MKRLLLITFAALTMLASMQHSAAQSKTRHKTHQNKEAVVHITRTGSKYHSTGCRYLRQSDITISKSVAITRGYTACSI